MMRHEGSEIRRGARGHWRVLCAPLALLVGCSEATHGTQSPDPGGAVDDGGVDLGDAGAPLSVDVPAKGRAFVELKTPALVSPPDEGAASTGWDLAFQAFDVFTNSGPSGPGDGGGFGPLDPPVFLSEAMPEIPFITQDETGGAFFGWYFYDGDAHALWSRYHLYGVRDGDRLWKVQIVGYYGEEQGAPVSARYQLRYAEVGQTGAGATTTLTDVDGAAGGPTAPADAPSECVDLGTGQRRSFTPDQAHDAMDWHLCFRRDAISVNGERGGPRGVVAVDLDGARTAAETLAEVQAKTPDAELARFDAIGIAEITDAKLAYHGDRIVSVFSDQWIEPGSRPPLLAPATWLVVAADGASNFLVAFERLEDPTGDSPGKVGLRVRPVK